MKTHTSARTKRQIADEFIAMVTESSLEKIRISELCERCGITRRTFYYHFHDKYDIVRWIHYTEYAEATAACPDTDPNSRFAYAIQHALLDRRDYYRKVLRYNGQNSLTGYLVEDTVRVYEHDLQRHLHTEVLSPGLEALIRYHAYGSVLTVLRWLVEGSPLTAEEIVALITAEIPDILHVTVPGSDDNMMVWDVIHRPE